MATLYVDSNNGSPVSPYDTKAKAANSIVVALADAACTAGSLVLVAHDHDHSVTDTAITYVSVATYVLPITITCINFTTDAYATTAKESILKTASTSVDMTFDNSLRWYGFNFLVETDNFEFPTGITYFEDCHFKLDAGANADMGMDQGGAYIEWVNVWVEFTHTSNDMDIGRGYFTWTGGGIVGTVVSTGILSCIDSGAVSLVKLKNLDFSSAALPYLIELSTSSTTLYAYHFELDNIVLNAATDITSNAPGHGVIVNARNTTSTSSKFHRDGKTRQGVTVQATNCYRQGGAKYEGVGAYSVKLVSTAETDKAYRPYRKLLATRWIKANATIRVELLHDQQGSGTGSDFQDDELWLEIEYPDATKNQLRNTNSTRMVLNGTPADIANSIVDWAEDLSNPVKQKFEVTISGGVAGPHSVWLCLAPGAVKTVYACPKLEVTSPVAASFEPLIPFLGTYNDPAQGSGGGGMLVANKRGNMQ